MYTGKDVLSNVACSVCAGRPTYVWGFSHVNGLSLPVYTHETDSNSGFSITLCTYTLYMYMYVGKCKSLV